jgi:penicillin-binding protein 1A
MPDTPAGQTPSRPPSHYPQPGKPLVFVAPRIRMPSERRDRAILIALLVCLFLLSFATVGGICFLVRIYATLPTIEQLHDIVPPQASRVLARNGALIHEFSTERRTWVSIAKTPQCLSDAIVSIEDRRFYHHWGIDMHRIVGAAVVNVARGHYAQGGSTITQQLARNLYLTAHQSLIRKIREALTAIQLESYYTKREILESYLNQVYLGAGVFGVQAASMSYFSRDVSALGLNEAATLAGTIQLPERYRPDRPGNLTRAAGRRAAVLRAMAEMRFITARQADSVMALPVPSNPSKPVVEIAPYFLEMVRQYISRKFDDEMLYNGGLTIYTPLDPVAQDTLEKAVAVHLRTLQTSCNALFLDSTKANVALHVPRDTFLAHFDSIYAAHSDRFDTLPDSVRVRTAQVSVVALDVATGGIMALIGGRDYAESKFNRAVQAVRQPGSAMKPIVYAAAMDTGFTPASVVLDQPITLMTDKGEWRPENYGKTFSGPVTLRAALAKSINLVAIQVVMRIGPARVVQYARKMGLTHDVPAVPAVAIGGAEATPMEMTAAYLCFASGGIYREPYCVEKIVSKDGRVLDQHEVVEHEALTPQTAYLLVSMMQDVVLRGTAAAIAGLGFTKPAAGKTGTTNDYSDAWFVGYTPQVVCGVWTGVDERRSMGRGITGADAAIPIWVPGMVALHRTLPIAQFQRPEGIIDMDLCSESHKVATMYCPARRQEVFKDGTVVDTCDIHGPRRRPEENLHQLFGAGVQRKPDKADSTKVRKPKLIF